MTLSPALDHEADLLARLVQDMPFVGMALVDTADGHILRVNQRLQELLGYSLEELLAMAWPQLIHGDDLAADLAQISHVLAGERESFTLEQRLVNKRGECVETQVHCRRERGPDGHARYLLRTVSDIGPRKQAESALRRANERLTRAQRAAGVGVWEWDMLSGGMDWSPELFQLFGLNPASDQASFDLWRAIVHPDDLDAAEERVQRAVRTRTPLESEFRIVLSSTEIRWIAALGDTIYDVDGQPVHMSGICLDITARMQADAGLRAERDTNQRYLDTVETVIVALDAAGRITLLNRKGHALLGYAAGELDGADWFERCLPAPEGREQVFPIFRRLMAGELANVEYFENPIVTRTGERRLIAWHNTLLRDDAGRISGVLSAGEDITERRRAENALRYQLELNRSITDKAMDAIFVNDTEGRVTFANPEALRLFGYGETELLGRHLHDVIHHSRESGEPYPAHACPLCEVYSTGQVIRDHESVFFRKDGTPVYVTASNAALEADGRSAGAVLVLHDVTAYKLAEEALRERDADLNRAQSVGRIGSWRLDVRRNRLTWSPENHRIFGIAEGTPLTYDTFLSSVHPDDRDYVDRMWQAGLEGKPYDIEHRLVVDGKVKWVREKAELEFDGQGQLLGGFGITQDITDIKLAEEALRASEARLQLATEIARSGTWDWDVASGEVIWSRGHFDILGYRQDEVTPSYQAWADRVHPDDRAATEAEIRRAMAEHQDYAAEFRVVWPDGSVHWMSARGRYEYAASGQCSRMLGVMADITNLKEAELALLDASRRKDEFLAMLAHELRNPLAPIRNAAHVLGQLRTDEPRVRWAQEIIERQVVHLSRLVDDLLDVSRIVRGKVTLQLTTVDLADLVRHALESTRPLMEARGHQLYAHLPPRPVSLRGDPARLTQVLVNLLDNAAKYTPDGGHITLEAQTRDGWLELGVRDDGLGMPADLLPRVFDLFSQGERTLDRSQGGLGIGLTLVRNLVDMHGGQVTAASPGPGLGSTFLLRLPLAAAAADTDPAKPAAKPPGMRVLVVDDDPAVAESTEVFLEMDGHTVRTAASGEAALELLADFQAEVVLLDLGLPGLDGYATASRLRQLPGGDRLRLIAVSGYGSEEVISRCRAAGFDQHLVKPINPAALAALLKNAGRQSVPASAPTA